MAAAEKATARVSKMTRMMLRIAPVLLVALLPAVSSVAVMSVDLGSEIMKIGVVSPGVPMEIVLNKESKRKTPVGISFRDGERLFGEDALSTGVRFPSFMYHYFIDLVGKSPDNPAVALFRKRFPYYEFDEEALGKGRVVFRRGNDSFTPEEMVAMVLSKARDYAQEFAGQPIKDVVVTVPAFFNQAERRAVLQAAELAGLKVLQLINDNTAVALNYGMFRRKDFNATPHFILFYDMGASSTVATVVGYQVVRTKERGGLSESNPQLSVLGVGYDRTLGGLEMQLRLRDFLAKSFNELGKAKGDVFESPRALAKLFKEAGRVKTVLSANPDHYAQVEGLLEEQDFRLHVTREILESLCTDIWPRVKGPADRALAAAGVPLENIDQVIIMGGGMRVPKIQEELARHLGRELGKSLNMDEAAAMGAVYKAADLGPGFKVKKFVVKDAVLFPLQVDFERELEDGTVKVARRTLFSLMNPYPQKKILTFNKHVTDFSFRVNYGDLDHVAPGEVAGLGSLNLTTVDLTGVKAAMEKNAGEGVESKGVKAHFTLDESGILGLTHVESVFEKSVPDDSGDESPFSKLGSTISKLFGGEDTPEPTEAPDDASEGQEVKGEEPTATPAPPSEGESAPPTTPAPDAKKEDPSNDTKPEPKKIVVMKEPVAASESRRDAAEIDADKRHQMQQKLNRLDESDRKRYALERARNSLESFVLDTQEKLDRREFQRASTEPEREKILTACSEISDWLYGDGDEAEQSEFDSRLATLRGLVAPLAERVREHRERPEALNALKDILNASSEFLGRVRSLDEKEQYFTEVELATLERMINDTVAWKEKKEKEQAATPETETPKLTARGVAEKMAQLDREVKYLVNKARVNQIKREAEEKATKEENMAEDKEKPREKPETSDGTTEDKDKDKHGEL